MKKNITTVFFIFFVSSFAVFSQAEETITISTYYPSPNGVYRELRVQRMLIGENYFDSTHCWGLGCGANQIPDDTDLVVEDKMLIGTTVPQNAAVGQPLEVHGSVLEADGKYRNRLKVVQTQPNDATHLGGAEVDLMHGSSSANMYIGNWSFAPGPATYMDSMLGIILRDASVTKNQLLLFHDGTAALGLHGDVGIGTMTPQAKLDVVGNLRIGAYTLPSTDGTANQTLVTDGSGAVNWASGVGPDVYTLPGSGCSSASLTCAGGVATQKGKLKILTGTVVIPTSYDDKWFRVSWSNTPFTSIYSVVASMEKDETEGVGTRLVSGSNNSVDVISDYACPVHFIVIGE
ncbi:MAG: hypothetical protein WCY05_04620 [Candidatus Omnitrophota bacterium]